MGAQTTWFHGSLSFRQYGYRIVIDPSLVLRMTHKLQTNSAKASTPASVPLTYRSLVILSPFLRAAHLTRIRLYLYDRSDSLSIPAARAPFPDISRGTGVTIPENPPCSGRDRHVKSAFGYLTGSRRFPIMPHNRKFAAGRSMIRRHVMDEPEFPSVGGEL